MEPKIRPPNGRQDAAVKSGQFNDFLCTCLSRAGSPAARDQAERDVWSLRCGRRPARGNGASSLLGAADKGVYGLLIVKTASFNLRGQALVFLAVLGFQAGLAASGEEPAGPWPRSIDTPQGQCTVFQPQPAVLDGDRLSARAALAVMPGDSTNVVFGIARLQARVAQDPGETQTTVFEIDLTQASFAPANAASMAGLADALRSELATIKWTLPSEELRAGLDAAGREQAAARGISKSPPRILYSPEPAVLVVLDGPPQLRTLTNSPLMRVVNTPYAMLFEPEAKRYWLQGSQNWFSAPDWRGEWVPVAQAPTAVVAAPPQEATTKAPAIDSLSNGTPRIMVATEPSELVVTRGEPTFAPVAGSDLLYVSNSDQLLFFTIDTKEFYVALSGRWYRSPVLPGPWNAVAADELPAAFAGISPGSPKSEALTYVAGTVEAQDAVLQANIPQITAVDRGPADVEVTYDGTAQFQPVEDTGVRYASNTLDAVFLVRGNYYLCRDAVWYTGAGPDGPWSVSTYVPAEIHSLPPSNPHYNVKYVYVYGATPEEVYVGYVPGYSGCYVSGPTVVYGTGWWYPGYYGPSYCWSYPATFGFGFGYNSWSGWSVGVGFGYGWLSTGYGWGWGGYYPSCGWWGPSRAYWACAPRYPHYGGHHHGNGGYGHPQPYAGRPPGAPRGGSRSEVRKDAPSPYQAPGNPQRRTLPTYARTTKSPSPPSTALRSARGLESRSSAGAMPNRMAQTSRNEAYNRQGAISPGSAPSRNAAFQPPERSAPRTPTGVGAVSRTRTATAQPSRSTVVRSASVPSRSVTAPSQPARLSAPTRAGIGQATPLTPGRSTAVPANSGLGAGANASRIGTPTAAARAAAPTARSSFATIPQGTTRGTMTAPAPSRTWSGATPRYAPSSPVYSSGAARPAMPSYGSSYGSSGRAPSMRAPMAAPSAPMRNSSMPSYSAPMRGGSSSGFSAPMRSAPMGSSGGNFGRSAPTRGR